MDARAQVAGVCARSREGEARGESLQTQGEVTELGVQGEEAGGAELTGGEGVTVASSAGVTAGACDVRATEAGPCSLITALRRCTRGHTLTRCGERQEWTEREIDRELERGWRRPTGVISLKTFPPWCTTSKHCRTK